ncbi:MAG: carbohydrate ABC transporter permease [Acidimicrobiales bacterium]
MAVTSIPPVTAPPAGGPPPTPRFVGRPDAFRRRLARIGWAFTAPSLVLVGVVTIFPIVFSIVMSLTHVSVTASGFHIGSFTWGNYSLVLKSGTWQYALWFTVVYTVVTVIAELLIGTCIALVLERLVRGRGILMALLLIPWSLITVISAELWKYIYDPTFGIADRFFQAVGMGQPVILGSNLSAIIAMMVADVWKTTPFVAIIVLAGLMMIPQELYEAADVDGASSWTMFWRVTFPLLRPTIALAVLFRVLQAFGLFDLPYVLTQGGPGNSTTPLAILGYDVMFKNLSFGPGAAIATSTAMLVVLGCFLFLRVFRAQVGKEEL